MDKLIVDSGLIVEYLKNGGGLLPQIWDNYKLCVSVATLAEVLASKRAAHPAAAKQINDFFTEHFEMIDINADIARAAARLLREHNCTLAAALAAATAIQLDIPLITYDLKTFDNIPQLKLVDI